MTLHVKECLDLTDGKIFAVPEGHELIKGTEQFVGILDDLALIEALAGARNYLCKQVQGVDILQNV